MLVDPTAVRRAFPRSTYLCVTRGLRPDERYKWLHMSPLNSSQLTQAATGVTFKHVGKLGGVTTSAGVDVQGLPNAVGVYFSDTAKDQKHEGIQAIAVDAGHPSGQAASASWSWRYPRQATTSDLPRRHPELLWTPPPSDSDAADGLASPFSGEAVGYERALGDVPGPYADRSSRNSTKSNST